MAVNGLHGTGRPPGCPALSARSTRIRGDQPTPAQKDKRSRRSRRCARTRYLSGPLQEEGVQERQGGLLAVRPGKSLYCQVGAALSARLPGSSQSSPTVPLLRGVTVASPGPCRTGSFQEADRHYLPVRGRELADCQVCVALSPRLPGSSQSSPAVPSFAASRWPRRGPAGQARSGSRPADASPFGAGNSVDLQVCSVPSPRLPGSSQSSPAVPSLRSVPLPRRAPAEGARSELDGRRLPVRGRERLELPDLIRHFCAPLSWRARPPRRIKTISHANSVPVTDTEHCTGSLIPLAAILTPLPPRPPGRRPASADLTIAGVRSRPSSPGWGIFLLHGASEAYFTDANFGG